MESSEKMDFLAPQSVEHHLPIPLVDTQPSSSQSRTIGNTASVPGQRTIFALGKDGEFARSIDTMSLLVVAVTSLDEILQQITHSTFGCVVVDADSIDGELSALTSRLWRTVLAFPVVFVVSTATRQTPRELFLAGASDVVCKPLALGRLEAAIQIACQRDATGAPSARSLRMRLATLSERERQVLQLCLKGAPAKVVASQLGVTFQTIDKHRARALRKMGAGSLLELAQAMSHVSQNALLNFV